MTRTGLGSQSPNHREGLTAISSITGNAEYVHSTNNALDINATFSASSISINDGANSAIKATVFDLTDSNPLGVAIVDANGDQISTFGGGTQYTDGAVAPAHAVGTMPVFNNLGNISQVTDSIGLPVSLVSVPVVVPIAASNGAGITVTGSSVDVNVTNGSLTVDAIVDGHTSDGDPIATGNPVWVAAKYNATPPTYTDGDQTSLQSDISGNLLVGGAILDTIENDLANIKIDTGNMSSALSTIQDIVIPIDTPVGATNATSLVGVIRKDTPANLSGTDGDAETLQVSGGRLWASVKVDTALPAGTNAIGKLAANDGVDIGDVTINNGSGASAVNIQDGGNSITVDGTVSITANSAINVAQINGVTPLMGNGVTGTGSQRVTIASDNTAFSVNPLSATAPVSTMNSASANSGLNSALALVFDDTSPTSITENNFGFARMSANRNQYMTIRDAAGNERGVNVTAGNALQSDLTSLAGTATAVNNGTASAGTQRVTIASDSTGNIATIGTSVTPGTGATNLGKAEDAAHTTGDVGTMALGVRESTPTDLSAGATNGDYEPFQVSRDGAVWISSAAAPQGGWSVATGSIGATKTDIGTANTAGCVGGWYFYNSNSSVAYVQFFNTQASGVTLGSTAPVYSIGIPATSGANVMSEAGIQHSTAICIAITTTRAGSTGPSSTVDYNIWYKQ